MRPPRLSALALVGTLVAAPLLNGCSNTAQQNGGIAGAGSGGGATSAASAAPSVSLAPVAGLDLSFLIPADLALQFQTSAQASATANRIETILVDQYEAYIEALSSGGAGETNYKLLTVAGALSAENADLVWWKQHDERVTGVDRLYDFTVGTVTSKADLVAFSYCEDSTRLQYKNLVGGPTIPNTAGATANHTLREGQLAKGKGELWAVSTLLTQNGAQQCMHG
ncbi:MAG TPA: hypothetical protein VH372_00310 [Actinospica sp.]|nr:hypothetical protein [Actinospica sp.]